MPTYYKGGIEKRNVGKLTSRGYFIRRAGNVIYRRWGAVELSGHTYKRMIWANGYPVTKEDRFDNIEEASEFMRVHVLRRLSNGYKKIPNVIK